MLRVNADSHYIFFFLAAVLSYRWYLQMKKKEFLVIFAICLGLAVKHKLEIIKLLEQKNLDISMSEVYSSLIIKIDEHMNIIKNAIDISTVDNSVNMS
jgi:hypothetical protein